MDRPQPRGTAIEAGVRLLARRAHSRLELAQKLARRGHSEEEIQAALDRLRELGYLDDAAFAAALVRHRAGSRGTALIEAELRAKGVEGELIERAAWDLDADQQLEAALEVSRRARRGRDGLDGAQVSRILGQLRARGFSGEVISAVRRRLAADLEGSAPSLW